MKSMYSGEYFDAIRVNSNQVTWIPFSEKGIERRIKVTAQEAHALTVGHSGKCMFTVIASDSDICRVIKRSEKHKFGSGYLELTP